MAFWKGTVTSEKPYTHMHHNHCSYIIQGSEIKLTAKQFLGFFFFSHQGDYLKGSIRLCTFSLSGNKEYMHV